jgi:hypothetical protein
VPRPNFHGVGRDLQAVRHLVSGQQPAGPESRVPGAELVAVSDAWIDHEKTKIGYEIPFNRHFYVFKPPRDLAEIDAELKGVTDRILTMIGGLSK